MEILIVCLLLLLVIIWYPLSFHIQGTQNHEQIVVNLYWLPLPFCSLLKIKLNRQQKTAEQAKDFKNGKQGATKKSIWQIIGHFLDITTVHKINLQVRLGTGNAASTSILAGLLLGLLNSCCAVLEQAIGKIATQPIIIVEPSFNEEKIACNLECIFSIFLGDIIITAITHWGREKLLWLENTK